MKNNNAILEQITSEQWKAIAVYATEMANRKAEPEQSEQSSQNENRETESKTLERRIMVLLKELGIPTNILGYGYLKEALAMAIEDKSCINAVTKVLYPDIAKKFNTTQSRVERAIRHAIEVAWDRCNMERCDEIFGYTIDPSRGKPTNSQFIAMIAEYLVVYK